MAISRSDAERLLRFVAEAESIRKTEPFPPELLAELGRIVEADSITYCELDRVRGRTLLVIQRSPDDEDDVVEENVFWEIVVKEHPVCLRHEKRQFTALKLSDFLSLKQLRRSRLYDVWFRPYGVERELNIPIPSPLWHTKTFLFDRRDGAADFTERDRLVLNHLQPHLARLWVAARDRRLLRTALAYIDRADETQAEGVIFLAPEGGIDFASGPARRLLHDFFPGGGSARLPDRLADWLASGAGPLVLRSGRRRLTIERSDNALVLRERHVDVELTAREREVLSWVARGKTNPEIAEALWLAPSTVRKHLENVYAKLGVSTRTAAVARFLGLIEAEASEAS